MNQYLLTLLIKNSLDEKARKELVSSMTKRMGKVIKENEWGSRDLAYPIMKQDKAYYVHLEFESDPATVPQLDKILKVEEDIIRYLLVRAD